MYLSCVLCIPVSLDCLFTLPLRYSLTCICPVSCVPYVASFSGLSFYITPSVFSNMYLSFLSCVSYVASFSGLSFYITPSVFSNMYLSCVLCILCCQFLWIFLLLPLRYSLTCICPVSCVSYVASFSGLSFYITPSVFSNMYLSCVLCILCCQFLWIVLLHYPFGIL